MDPALVAAVLGLGRDAILYGPDMLGRLLDTFVAAQLRSELAASSNEPRLYHLREEQGRREVDLLIETAGGWNYPCISQPRAGDVRPCPAGGRLPYDRALTRSFPG